MMRLVCDRCGDSFDNPQIFPLEKPPTMDAKAPNPYRTEMPDDWRIVLDKHLCGRCVAIVTKTMETPPGQG